MARSNGELIAPVAQVGEQSADARDAARYRWLRDQAREADGVAPIAVMMDWRGTPVGDELDSYGIRSGDVLDHAMDAAMGVVRPGTETCDHSEGGHHD